MSKHIIYNKEQLVKTLRSIFDMGEFNFENLEHRETLKKALDITDTFLEQTYTRWESDKKLELGDYKMAPQTRHSNEIVIINGERYRDVTDYIVDCGA